MGVLLRFHTNGHGPHFHRQRPSATDLKMKMALEFGEIRCTTVRAERKCPVKDELAVILTVGEQEVELIKLAG